MLVSWYYREGEGTTFFASAGVSALLGSIAMFAGRNALPVLGRREGSVIVTSIWLVFSFIGMLPYLVSGSISSVTDAFFDSLIY